MNTQTRPPHLVDCSLKRPRGWRMAVFFLALAGAALPARAQLYNWTNFAGQGGGQGNADGTGTAARFSLPYSVAVDSSGNTYVADSGNSYIRKITPAGVVTVFAGVHGEFNSPEGVAVDSNGNVYVADTYNQVIQMITPAGVVTQLAGTLGTTGSATNVSASSATFDYPYGVAVDGSGNVYVADTYNNVIRVISGGQVTTIAGSGSIGSTNVTTSAGSDASFNQPHGVAVDSEGNVYVADTGNNTIREITPTAGGSVPGNFATVTTITVAGSSTQASGSANVTNGSGSAASFYFPSGVAVFGSGASAILYVSDSSNNMVRKIVFNTSPNVTVTTFAGSLTAGDANGTGGSAGFYDPQGVAVDGSGNIYVADAFNEVVRKITSAAVVSTLAGGTDNAGFVNGTGSAAQFDSPIGVALDASGNAYVADSDNNAIRKITSAGAVTTLASGGLLNTPSGVAVDSINGYIYVANSASNNILQITTTGTVTNFAGDPGGNSGSTDVTSAPGSGALFAYPSSLAIDTRGNIYVADTNNSTIREITPGTGGNMTTVTYGIPQTTGANNGAGNTATFDFPEGVAADGSGNVYVADNSYGDGTGNGLIRKIVIGSTPANSTVSTLAGGPGFNADGSTTAASFYNPAGIGVDGSGNVYVADDSTIRIITTAGQVTTIGGTPNLEGSNIGYATNSLFAQPQGLAVTSAGVLYVGDTNNNRIAMGASQTAPAQVWIPTQISSVANMETAGNRLGAASTKSELYFYKGTDKNIWGEYLSGTQWNQLQLTSAGNVGDWLTYHPSYNYLYYMDTNANVDVVYHNGSQWPSAAITSNSNVAGDITVDNSNNLVFYCGTDKTVWALGFNGTVWSQASLGGTTNVAGNLTVDTQYHIVYYRTTTGQLACYFPSGNVWKQQILGATTNVGGALVSDAPGSRIVHYRSSVDNSPWVVYYNGSQWLQVALGTPSVLTNTAALYTTNTMLYLDLNGQCNVLYLPSGATAWLTTMLGGGGSELIGSLSSNVATGLVFAGRSDGHIDLFLYGQPPPQMGHGSAATGH